MYTIESPVGTVYIEKGEVFADDPNVAKSAKLLLMMNSVSSLLEPDPDYTDATTLAKLMKGKVVEPPKKITRDPNVIY
jgi:hypothetical protein